MHANFKTQIKANTLPLKVVLNRVGEATLAQYGAAQQKLDEPQKGFDFWQAVIAQDPSFEEEKEHLVAILLNTKYAILGYHVISVGSVNESIAHPREVFRAAIIAGATAIMICHNHPSGDPEPSKADHQTTRRLIECADILGIRLIDHLVIGDAQGGRKPYASFREMGVIF